MVDLILSYLVEHWFNILLGLVLTGVGATSVVSGNPVGVVVAVNGFIRKYWRDIVIALLVIASIMYVSGLKLTIKEQAKQLELDATNISVLTDNNSRLESGLQTQNMMISKFDQYARGTQTMFNDLSGTVAARNDELSKKLQTIAQAKKPQTCNDAIEYLIVHGNGSVK